MLTERSFEEGLVEISRLQRGSRLCPPGRAEAAAGPARTRSRRLRRLLGGAWARPASPLPENLPGSGIAALEAVRGPAGRGLPFQGGGRASGAAVLPARSPKCHRGVGGRLLT